MRPKLSSSEAGYAWVGIGVSVPVVLAITCAIYLSWK
jgi:hypothetical protein